MCILFRLAKMVNDVCSGAIFWTLSGSMIFLGAVLYQVEHVNWIFLVFFCFFVPLFRINDFCHFSAFSDHRQHGLDDNLRHFVLDVFSFVAIWLVLRSNISNHRFFDIYISSSLQLQLVWLSARAAQISTLYDHAIATGNRFLGIRYHWLQLESILKGNIQSLNAIQLKFIEHRKANQKRRQFNSKNDENNVQNMLAHDIIEMYNWMWQPKLIV